MYTMSAMPSSVIMVAGLELTRTVVTPSSLEGLARLGAGVIELRRLPYDNGAGAYDQDFGDCRCHCSISHRCIHLFS